MVYIYIANMRVRFDEAYQHISSRIYIVVGIIALFMIAYTLLLNIINPDDKKNSNGLSFVKSIMISIICVVLVPVFFDFIYGFQRAVITGNIIDNLFMVEEDEAEAYTVNNYLIYQMNNKDYYVCSTCDLKNLDQCTANQFVEATSSFNPQGYTGCNFYSKSVDYDNLDIEAMMQQQAGNTMAYHIMEGFLSPVKDGDEIIIDDTSGFFGTVGENIEECVGDMITLPGIGALTCSLDGLFNWFDYFSDLFGEEGIIDNENYSWSNISAYVKLTGDFTKILPFSEKIAEGEISYTYIVSTIMLGFVIYMLISFIIDLGIRVLKLTFYQVLAPIPIFFSILPSNKDLLKNWFKLVLTTYVEVFVRIACLSGVAFLVKLIMK